jgi:hypothetical protein
MTPTLAFADPPARSGTTAISELSIGAVGHRLSQLRHLVPKGV